MNFLGKAGWYGIRNYVWLAAILLFIAAIVAAVMIGRHAVDRALEQSAEQGEEIGGQAAVIAGQKQTLDQLGDAKNAENDLTRAGDRSAIGYNECLRNNRRKQSCERYKPLEEREQLVPGG